jgi:hypothetical protein
MRSPARSAAREHRHRLLRVGWRQRHRRDGAGQVARGPRTRRAHDQHRAAVPPSEYQPGLSFHRVHTPATRSSASRSTCCRSPPRSCTSRAITARHHPRALRGAARHRGVSRAQILLALVGRTHGAEGDHDAARHRHHAHRQRPLLLGDRRRSRSSSRTASPRCRRASGRHDQGPRRAARHRGHSQLPRLCRAPARERGRPATSSRRSGRRRK